LDPEAAATFLDGDGLKDHVWSWYGRTIREFGIRSIPLFSFSVPAIGVSGGPFRPLGEGGDAYVVRGSMNADYFLELFEVILRDQRAGSQGQDARSQAFFQPYNDNVDPSQQRQRRRRLTEKHPDGGSCSREGN